MVVHSFLCPYPWGFVLSGGKGALVDFVVSLGCGGGLYLGVAKV